MQEIMKRIGIEMSVLMGLTMSFCLSLVGTLTGGHFTPIGWLVSFGASLLISLLIGFIIPMGKVTGDFCRKRGLQPGQLKTRIVESLLSDLIYTPVITLAMVSLAYVMAMKQSDGRAQLNFIMMFLPSLLICFVVGFVIIFIIQPIFLKLLMKKYNIEPPKEQPKE